MSQYTVDSMAVAAYLDVNGLKYIKSQVQAGRNEKPVVVFVFEDEKGIASDLERAYRNSKEKKYRDSLLYFRGEIFKVLEGGR